MSTFISRAPDPATGIRGPLDQLSFAVKDNINTADLPTSDGTPALRGARPAEDAPVVAKLRRAGAILVGKTNMHELALGTTNNNASFGRVHNPRAEGRSPGGSSGGSAAAVAAREAHIALGTDTGGSVRIPASYCGIVGYRPSIGRWGNEGCVPLSPTRDTIGLLADSTHDVALVDQVITGQPMPKTVTLQGIRLGVPREGYYADLNPAVAELASRALDRLADAGAELVEVRVVAAHELDDECGFSIVRHELVHAMPAYLATLREPHPTWAEVAAQISSPDVRDMVDNILAEPTTVERYRECLALRTQLQAAYAHTFHRDRIAALVYPTVIMPPPPLDDDVTTVHNGREVDLFTSVHNTSPGSVAGQPSISLPAGETREGWPVGMSLEGAADADSLLLSIATAAQPVLGEAVRRSP